jgi:hypothetical protein
MSRIPKIDLEAPAGKFDTMVGVAQHLGVSPRTVEQWRKAGKVAIGADGLWDSESVKIAAIQSHPELVEGSGEDGGEDVDVASLPAKQRKEHWEALLKELDYKKKTRELIPVEEHLEAMQSLCKIVIQHTERWVGTMPARLEGKALRGAIYKELDTARYELLRDMQGDLDKLSKRATDE